MCFVKFEFQLHLRQVFYLFLLLFGRKKKQEEEKKIAPVSLFKKEEHKCTKPGHRAHVRVALRPTGTSQCLSQGATGSISAGTFHDCPSRSRPKTTVRGCWAAQCALETHPGRPLQTQGPAGHSGRPALGQACTPVRGLERHPGGCGGA